MPGGERCLAAGLWVRHTGIAAIAPILALPTVERCVRKLIRYLRENIHRRGRSGAIGIGD